MPKEKLSVDNQEALQQIQQVSQAAKELYQILKQIKSSLSGIAGAAANGGAVFEASNAQASADSSSGVNLAGMGLPGNKFNLSSVLSGNWGNAGTNNAATLNPSIVAAQNQSAAVNVQALPTRTLPARDAQGRFVSAGNADDGYVFGGDNPGVAFKITPGMRMRLQTSQMAAHLAASGINLAAQQEQQGGNPVGAQYQFAATALSTGIGFIAGGATLNPAIGLAAAGISNTIFSPIASYLSAPQENRQSAAQSLTPFTAAAGGFNGRDYIAGRLLPFTNSMTGRYNAGQLQRITDISNARNPGYDGERTGTIQDTASVYGAISSALFASGNNPLSFSEHYRETVDPYGAARPLLNPGKARGGYNLLNTLAATAGTAVANHARTRYDEDETLAETYTRRATTLFGTKNAPGIIKRIAPIFAGLPDTGDNITDLLTHYGAEDTLDYLRLQNDKGLSPVNPQQLANTGAGLRAGTRLQRRASFQARGKGAALSQILTGERSLVADLPGGRDSDTYAELGAQLRDAGRQAFDEGQITRYGIPEARLRGEQERLQYEPFSPSAPVKLGLASIQLNNQRITDLTNYREKRHKSGQLSEPEELDLENEIQSAQTNRAAGINALQDGFLDRLPSLAAGRPSFGAKYTSYSAAAANLSLMTGNTIGVFGANGGRHLQRQESIYREAGGSPEALAPHSRMSGLDANGGGRVEGLLERIATALERGTGGNNGGNASLHPGETLGGAMANLSSRDTGQRGSNPNRN